MDPSKLITMILGSPQIKDISSSIWKEMIHFRDCVEKVLICHAMKLVKHDSKKPVKSIFIDFNKHINLYKNFHRTIVSVFEYLEKAYTKVENILIVCIKTSVNCQGDISKEFLHKSFVKNIFRNKLIAETINFMLESFSKQEGVDSETTQADLRNLSSDFDSKVDLRRLLKSPKACDLTEFARVKSRSNPRSRRSMSFRIHSRASEAMLERFDELLSEVDFSQPKPSITFSQAQKHLLLNLTK